MPQLNIPLDPDGMIVPAVVGLNALDTATLLQTGQPVPKPVKVLALLDTGTDATAVTAHVLAQLGLLPLVSGSTQTAAGPIAVNLYRVSLTLSGPAGVAGPMLVRTDLLVPELTVALPRVEVLVGMDVLSECLLVLDGPGQQFILAF